MQLQMNLVEEACKELYIRALKILPDDIKVVSVPLKSIH
jgi:fumarate hydratase subunit alpha/L(+)-tartrate dehydratase alpha subunit